MAIVWFRDEKNVKTYAYGFRWRHGDIVVKNGTLLFANFLADSVSGNGIPDDDDGVCLAVFDHDDNIIYVKTGFGQNSVDMEILHWFSDSFDCGRFEGCSNFVGETGKVW